MISLVGLGPGGIDGVSAQAMAALRSARKVFVRTERHPAVAELSDRGFVFESFDGLYEAAETFEELYGRIAGEVLSAAALGDVAYAVPGHPLVGERSVELIVARARGMGIDWEIAASPSFIEATLDALGAGLGAGLKILDALDVENLSPSLDTPNLIYQTYDKAAASRVKLRLMEFFPHDATVFVVRGAGALKAKVLEVPLDELDRQEFDHLTSVYVPMQVES